MIKASVSIAKEMTLALHADDIKQHVKRTLSYEIASEVEKRMAITRRYDPMTGNEIFTATYPISSSTVSTISSAGGYNGITGHVSKDVQIKLRVVEYTNKGKVTRVELQRYDENTDSWSKIPRVQIEE